MASGCFGWLVDICVGLWRTLWRMCGALGGGLVCGPWDSGRWGGAVSVSVAFCLGFLVGAGDMTSGGVRDGGPFGVILCVGRVAGL